MFWTPNNGGVHPWTSEQDAESHLILFNHSARPQKFDVAISSGQALWDKTYFVDPSETLEISFNQLIRDKVKDDKGQRLDPTQNHGVVNWVTPDSGNATGRLMVTSRQAVMARNYSCGNFVIPCGGYFQEISEFIGIGQALALYGLNVNYCNSYNPGQCYGNQQGSGSASFSSTTSSPNVIAFNGSSQQYSQNPSMLGMAAGSSSFTETAEGNGCQVNGSGGATVQIPTSSRIVQTISSGSAVCGSDQAGWLPGVQKIVTDQNGNDMVLGGQNLSEVINIPQPNALGIGSQVTGTAVTNSSGIFNDTYFVCSAACPGNGQVVATQTITDSPANYQGIFPWDHQITYSCTNITVDGK